MEASTIKLNWYYLQYTYSYFLVNHHHYVKLINIVESIKYFNIYFEPQVLIV